MDQAQVFLAAGLICTIAFAGFVLLDTQTDGVPDWEVLDLCLADHAGALQHYHATLDIHIDESPAVEIPANTRIQDSVCPNGMRGIHTHNSDNNLHIETPNEMDAPLGAFFQIWGEKFDETHILNRVANDDKEIVMYVNGQQNFDYENYVIKDGDEISIRYQQRQ